MKKQTIKVDITCWLKVDGSTKNLEVHVGKTSLNDALLKATGHDPDKWMHSDTVNWPGIIVLKFIPWER